MRTRQQGRELDLLQRPEWLMPLLLLCMQKLSTGSIKIFWDAPRDLFHPSPPWNVTAVYFFRFWEGDHDINAALNKTDIEAYNVTDISRQLVESDAGNKLDIMLGGGRASFLPLSRKPQPVNRTEPTSPGFDYNDENDMWENYRDDGRDLLAEWANNTDHGTRKYIATKAELLSNDLTKTDQVMGEHSKFSPNAIMVSQASSPTLTWCGTTWLRKRENQPLLRWPHLLSASSKQKLGPKASSSWLRWKRNIFKN